MESQKSHERTLVLIKPDAVQRGLVGDITARFEHKGLKLVGQKMMRMDEETARRHYKDHVGKPFYPGLAKFMMENPLVAQCWEGAEAVEVVRRMCGKTLSRQADPGTIRGDFGMSVQSNLVHASDSMENAEREIRIFFGEHEIFEYRKAIENCLYAEDER